MATDLGPFEVGQIWALHKEGYSHRQITDRVTRGRAGPGPSLTAVADTVRRLLADPTWTGGRASGSGRKRQTTSTEDKAMVRAVKRHRGSRKVTSTTLRGRVRAARRVSSVIEATYSRGPAALLASPPPYLGYLGIGNVMLPRICTCASHVASLSTEAHPP